MMFIWDQLFLADWALFAMQRFCLAILRLLREQLMAAETFEQLHKVSYSVGKSSDKIAYL